MTYSDVGGCKEQIEKLREVVETPLLHVSHFSWNNKISRIFPVVLCKLTKLSSDIFQPEKFVNLGIEPPKGVLLFGPPGTGKTLCARAVANRTDACFIRVIGSELVQKYVGEVRQTSIYFVSHETMKSRFKRRQTDRLQWRNVCELQVSLSEYDCLVRVQEWCGNCSRWPGQRKRVLFSSTKSMQSEVSLEAEYF